jgi:hypothetical protein
MDRGFGPAAIASLFEVAWNAHDVQALAALFHPDASFVNRFGNYVRGVEAIVTMHRPIRARPPTIYPSRQVHSFFRVAQSCSPLGSLGASDENSEVLQISPRPVTAKIYLIQCCLQHSAARGRDASRPHSGHVFAERSYASRRESSFAGPLK